MSYQTINPATGVTLQTFEETTDQELEAALETAAACYQSWRDLSFAERAAIANKASEILLSRIDDPRIKGVALTGSEVAGAKVAERAGKNLKKSTLELGGSDAFIVLEDADLEGTLKWALWAKMNNAGQCCIAAKRIIVVEEIADVFFKTPVTAANLPGWESKSL